MLFSITRVQPRYSCIFLSSCCGTVQFTQNKCIKIIIKKQNIYIYSSTGSLSFILSLFLLFFYMNNWNAKLFSFIKILFISSFCISIPITTLLFYNIISTIENWADVTVFVIQFQKPNLFSPFLKQNSLNTHTVCSSTYSCWIFKLIKTKQKQRVLNIIEYWAFVI